MIAPSPTPPPTLPTPYPTQRDRDILSTDFSGVVIDMMRARHEESRPGLRWEKMDMLALDFPDGSVDAVVDKVRGSVERRGGGGG